MAGAVRASHLLSAILLPLLVLPASASAEQGASTTGATKPAAGTCTSRESRQFDFWIGDWEVRTPDGKVAGTNRIEAILGGCAIQESWKGAKGMAGTSINMYDPVSKRWHQTWMDDRGTLLLLDGGFEEGKMILSGDAPVPGKPGVVARQRISWSPLPDGTVRQLWESSEDGGKVWTVAFDGIYSRKP